MEPWGGSDGAAEYPNINRVAATARRWWWALLLGALAGAALALAAGGSSGSTYQASARLLVGPIGGEYSVIRAAGQQAETYADLVTSRPVLDATLRRLGSRQTSAQLRRNAQARADQVTRLLTITVSSSRPDAAANTANALAAELQRATQTDHPIAGGELQVIDPAQPPTAPQTQRDGALVLVAALAGLLGMLALVLVADLSRGLIATADELGAAIPVPVLGQVGRRRLGRRRAIDVVGLVAPNRERVVVAGVQDRRSGALAALALADALVAAGARVVLVDADTTGRSQSLSWRLRLDRRPGLAEALVAPPIGSQAPDLDALIVARGPRLGVLPHGDGERAGSVNIKRVARLLRRLGREADVLVISAPPTSSSAFAALGSVADGVVLAVPRHRASTAGVHNAAEVLARMDVPVLGTLLVRATSFRRRVRAPRGQPRAPVDAPATIVPAGDRLAELQS